jgi:small subunit ribosomal protein S4
VETKGFKGVFKAVPDRAELSQEIDESLVVALYSK